MSAAGFRAGLTSLTVLGLTWRLQHHVSTWAAERGVRGEERGAAVNFDSPPLPDLLHDITTAVDFRAAWLHPDMFPALLMAGTLAFVVTRCPQRGRMLLEYVRACVLLLLMRCATVASTQLPSPTPQCRTRTPAHTVSNILYYCNDTIFSGHTSANLLAALIWWHSGGNSSRGAKAAALGLAAAGAMQVVVTRYHYTVDVVVAVLLTFWFVEAHKARWEACWHEPAAAASATAEDETDSWGKSKDQ